MVRKSKVSKKVEKEIIRLRRRGVSYKQIGILCGVSEPTAYNYAKKNGLPTPLAKKELPKVSTQQKPMFIKPSYPQEAEETTDWQIIITLFIGILLGVVIDKLIF